MAVFFHSVMEGCDLEKVNDDAEKVSEICFSDLFQNEDSSVSIFTSWLLFLGLLLSLHYQSPPSPELLLEACWFLDLYFTFSDLLSFPLTILSAAVETVPLTQPSSLLFLCIYLAF